MAKSKSRKSRRARRLEAEKQRQNIAGSAKIPEVETSIETAATPAVVESPASPEVRRKSVNFAQEYFYVYTELRNIFIIAVIMFTLMVGFLYVI
jgi:hypothetical protein